MTELRAQNITVSVGEKSLVQDASFTLAPGKLTVLLGPNGAGKTTLLRAALGLIEIPSGITTLDGKDITSLSPIARAQQIAYLPQSRPLAWPATVKDVVALGRFSHGAKLGKLGEADQAAVDEAMQSCDIAALANRRTDTLSGGETARMHCARAFATNAPLLLADEPVAALDPRHQFRIMDLLRGYVDTGGGALIVLHNLALAAQYADDIIWMKDGHIVDAGPREVMITEAKIAQIYGVKAVVKDKDISLLGPV
ncbi:ABC transporter ATP-binding protein [Fretibacter rubidus]|uniref:ABC transporter ATP-binding protein n=1 Tax=Fretibacter rubidus TaxID=570162 RepID=UPI00352A71BC